MLVLLQTGSTSRGERSQLWRISWYCTWICQGYKSGWSELTNFMLLYIVLKALLSSSLYFPFWLIHVLQVWVMSRHVWQSVLILKLASVSRNFLSSTLCSFVAWKTLTFVTALAKPNPSWSQIRLGLELSNASEPTPPPHPTPPETLYSLYLSHFLTDWAEILHDDSLGGKDQV